MSTQIHINTRVLLHFAIAVLLWLALTLSACGPGLIYTPKDLELSEAPCGDSLIGGDEICDDGNSIGGDGCSADCGVVEDGYACEPWDMLDIRLAAALQKEARGFLNVYPVAKLNMSL